VSVVLLYNFVFLYLFWVILLIRIYLFAAIQTFVGV